MSETISIYDSSAIDALRSELKFEPRRLRALRTAFFKHFLGTRAALAELPVEVRDEFARRVSFHPLSIEQAFDSQLDGATRLVLRTESQMLIESVLLRTGTGRVTLCVSSQVGCAAACRFCATGQMGIARNLSAAEIVDQVVLAGERLAAATRHPAVPVAGCPRRVRNIVFMGMGEPLHNEEQLYTALESLLAPEQFHHAASRLLISTVGIPDAMIRCARRFPRANLALSLHSVRQEVRETLIPLATRYSLDELRSAARQINAIQPQSLMIEYLMLEGVNDSADDAAELVDWLDGLDVHLNLIPYNSIQSAPELRSTDRAGRDSFAAIVRAAGISTTIRYSLGADVAAACGQLVQQENRQVARTEAISR